MKPQRIQRRRTKGYDMQAESMALNGLPAVSVCRPGPWGNSWKVGDPLHPLGGQIEANDAVRLFRDNFADELKARARKELRGKNLACFCKLDEPCHADVLLEIANGDEP